MTVFLLLTGKAALAPGSPGAISMTGSRRDTAALCPRPPRVDIQCVIERGGQVLYQGQASTGDLKRRCEELVDWLGRYNPIPPGTVLSTGTGILVPDDRALAAGDVVSITIDGIGTLRNPVARLTR